MGRGVPGGPGQSEIENCHPELVRAQDVNKGSFFDKALKSSKAVPIGTFENECGEKAPCSPG